MVTLWRTYVLVEYTHRSPGLLTRARTRLEVDAARKKLSRSCAIGFCPLLCLSLFETSLSYLMKIYVRCCSPLWCMALFLPCAVRDMRCCAGRHVESINYGELINHVELVPQQFLHRDFTTALAFLTFTAKWRRGSRCLRLLAISNSPQGPLATSLCFRFLSYANTMHWVFKIFLVFNQIK